VEVITRAGDRATRVQRFAFFPKLLVEISADLFEIFAENAFFLMLLQRVGTTPRPATWDIRLHLPLLATSLHKYKALDEFAPSHEKN